MTARRRSAPLEGLYRQIAAAPVGEQRLPLLRDAIMLAEESQDVDSLYELRCSLVESADRADDAELEVASFSWVLDKHLSDAVRFPLVIKEPHHVSLAWMFKWVLYTLTKNSAIQRGQIEATLSAMEDLYRRNGLGSSAPAYYQLCAAEHLGDVDRLEALRDRAEATPRDAYSDCVVCNPHWLATADLMLGDTAGAFRRGTDALAHGRTCLSEPHGLLADLLVPLLREGQLATAEDYLRRCRDKVWANTSERMAATGEIVAALAVTGNVASGLDLLERRLPDVATVTHDHRTRLGFFAGGALLLDRAVAAGLGVRPLRDFGGVLSTLSGASGPTVEQLAPAFWLEADALARAFDARAGNEFWQSWLAGRRALTTMQIPLSLDDDGQDAVLPDPEPSPQSAQDWLRWADERHWVGDLEGALTGVQTAIDSGELTGRPLVGALSSRVWRVALLLQSAANVTTLADLPATERQRFDATYEAYDRQLRAEGLLDRLKVAAALGIGRYDRGYDPDPDALLGVLDGLRADGVPAEELAFLEYRSAESLVRRGRGDEGVPLLFAARDHGLAVVDADPNPAEEATRVHLSTADGLARVGHPDALAELDAALALHGRNRAARAACLRLRAYLHARAGQGQQAERDARDAAQLYHALDADALAADCVGLQASVAEEQGNLGGSISATRRALALVERLESYDSAPLRTDLGRRLIRAGQPDQAVGVLRDLDRLLLTRKEEPGTTAGYDCAYWLGMALRDARDPDGALQVWQAALDLATRRGDGHAAVPLGQLVGALFGAYSMWDESLVAFRAAQASASSDADRAHLNERIGLTRCLAGDDGGVEDVRRAITMARELDSPLAVADWTDSLARGLAALGRLDEAVAAALDSSDHFARAGDNRGRLGELGYAARLLADAGRRSEAAALLDPVLADADDPADATAGADEVMASLRQLRAELGGDG